MPALGPMEIVLVAVLALLVFGPRKLPQMARQVGRAMNEFRRQASDLKREFSASLDEDVDRTSRARGTAAADEAPTPAGEPAADEAPTPGEPAAADATAAHDQDDREA